ncbi:MAG: transglutaminase domain-containing protein [Ignavibacteriaceae bacterium]
MIETVNISAQSSFGLSGYWAPSQENSTLLNSFEANPENFSLLKDWGLSFSYGGEFSSTPTSSLYLISLSKQIGSHFISVRYTPGYQKEFIFNNGQSILIHDSTSQALDSKFTYKELFGLGYSYKFSEKFSAGFSLRYFKQEYNQESVEPVFSDTLYLNRISKVNDVNFWRGDFGIIFSPSKNFSFSLSTINLLNFNESAVDTSLVHYEIKKHKGVAFGLSVSPVNNFYYNLIYETTNALQTGFNIYFNLFNGKAGFGVTAFHDNYQSPFITGVIPALSFNTKLFGVSLSGVKYFSNRNTPHTFSEFTNDGIDNIINNRYSYDKAILTVTFALNTIPEKEVEFLDVNIVRDIYPTMSDNYLNRPFATGRVVNLTGKTISVKPSSKIEGINGDRIISPVVRIGPKDTADVPFYTIIPQSYDKKKTGISFVDFFVTANNNEPDDQTQKPILVNGINSWDGKVINLRYFIKRDYEFSMDYSKRILSRYKSELDTLAYFMSIFYKAKILFNNFVKELVYTANPTAAQDYVQFPNETLKLKGGNCDDLSVLYSSLLESVGIQTALVDYKPQNSIGHVNILINTQLSPDQAKLITGNDSKYFIRKNESGVAEVWIPVETTSLTNFDKAWQLGAEKFNQDALDNLGLVKGNVEIVDVY